MPGDALAGPGDAVAGPGDVVAALGDAAAGPGSAVAARRGEWRAGPPWVADHRLGGGGGWRCDAARYADVRESLAAAGVVDRVLSRESVSCSRVRLPALRDDQRAAARAWWYGGGRGLVVMPTGTGKTLVALAIMARLGATALVVAPVRALVAQWEERIRTGLGVAPGVVGDGRYEPGPVTVATYHSAAARMEDLGGRFTLVVFDEVHHLPTGFFREAALRCAAPCRLGLTATPERDDGRDVDLGELVGPVLYRQDFVAARGRTVADHDVVRIPVALDDAERRAYAAAAGAVRRHVAERRRRDDRFAWSDVVAAAGSDPDARAALDAHRTKRRIEETAGAKLRALEELFVLHAGDRVIVFAGTNEMVRRVSTRFLVPAILSHTPRFERSEILRGFAGGEFPAIVANRVLDEGVDVPQAKVAVVLGGLRSARQATQRLGRVLRRRGRARAVLYEVVCVGTTEVGRSQARRKGDAYPRARDRLV